MVNAVFQGTSILEQGSVHLGVAAAIDEGLTVPVVKNAHAMSLRQLSAAIRAVVGKARDNRLGPDEVSGSTFTISNMGMLNVDSFSAIIVQPTSGLVTTEAGGTATFKIRLASQPSFDVLIPLSSSNTSEGTMLPASLTFTSATWSTDQTVIVTGQDDLILDGKHTL